MQIHFHIIFILLIPNFMQVMKFPSGLYWVIPYNDIISSYILSACLGMDIMLWTSVKDFGDYHISEQGRLR